MYLGDNLKAIFNSVINANAVQVKPDNLNAIFFESTAIAAGETGVSAWVDVRSDKEKTLFVKTAKNLSIYTQFSNDDTKESWYDLCDNTGAIVTFVCNNASKAIPISIKGFYMRILVKNNDTSSDTPYVEVT